MATTKSHPTPPLHQKTIEDISDEQLDRTFRTSIYAYFYLTRAALPHMKPGSTIINCVSPGPVWTPLNPSDKEPDKVATFGGDTPMKRPAQPEGIAPAFVFFGLLVQSRESGTWSPSTLQEPAA